MSKEFLIDLNWTEGECGPPEDRKTAARMSVRFDDQVATRNESEWTRSSSDDIDVSAYPLALWIAQSWWRLRWEPFPLTRRPSLAWRMAHEMPSAGHGYLWPRLSFASDGENIDVDCRPSPRASAEPVRFLSRFKVSLGAQTFEEEIDAFVQRVLERLNGTAANGDTELHGVWSEVLSERRDDSTSLWRRLEAQLGFDPDEAPEQVMQDLNDLSETAGEAAIAEVAPALRHDRLPQCLLEIRELARTDGVHGRISRPVYGHTPHVASTAAPWERGRELATKVRDGWAFSDDPVSDSDLSDLLGIPSKTFKQNDQSAKNKPLGLAVRESENSLNMHFRRQNRPDIRFEAARYLADHLTAPAADQWLPVTDTKTARQKMQRAFATEFLSPIDSVRTYLEDDYSESSIAAAAAHFGVTRLTIASNLANNGVISPEDVSNYQ